MTTDPPRIAVLASDEVLRQGLARMTADCAEFELVNGPEERVDAVVYASSEVTNDVLLTLQAISTARDTPLVLIADTIDDEKVAALVCCRVAAILPRSTTGHETLRSTLHAVLAGNAVMPSSLLAKVLRELRKAQRILHDEKGFNPAGLDSRELEVLRLVASGADTTEIATKLTCSERTVKVLLRDLQIRHELRDRTHAVAYAVRSGSI